MIPFFRRFLVAFFMDPLAFRRWMRGGMMAFAGSGYAFAEQIAKELAVPAAVTKIKVAAIVCGFIAGSIQSSAKKVAAKASGDKP